MNVKNTTDLTLCSHEPLHCALLPQHKQNRPRSPKQLYQLPLLGHGQLSSEITHLFPDYQRRWSWVLNSWMTKAGKRFSRISNTKMHVKATASTAPVMWFNTHSAADLPTVLHFLLPFARQTRSESPVLRVRTSKRPVQISRRRTRRNHRFLLAGYKWRCLLERNDLKPAEITR